MVELTLGQPDNAKLAVCIGETLEKKELLFAFEGESERIFSLSKEQATRIANELLDQASRLKE